VIAATLNTLVYNTLISSPSSASSSASSPLTPSQSALLEAATRCLLPLHDRDCRRAFCEPSLWLAPADRCPPPVISAAGAARHHGVGGEGGGGMGAMMGRGEVDWEMGEWMGELGMGGGAGGRGGELGGEGGVMMAGGGRERGGVEKGKEQQSGSAMAAVLRTLPHVLPFEKRVHIFRELIQADKARHGLGAAPGMGMVRPVVDVSVRRDLLVEDAFVRLNQLGPMLKGRVRVSFVNAFGAEEIGMDQGGLFKEFLTDLAKAAFDPGYGLFLQAATEEGYLYPHPAAAALGHGIPMVEFLGRIVGKALYEGILLEYSFAPLFVSKLVGRYAFLDELSSLDVELYRNLMYLKHYEGDASELALDFTVTEEVLGEHSIVELRPGGSHIAVTNENKLQYIHAVADYKLNRQMAAVVAAFLRGLSDLIQPEWLRLFSPKEFNQLLSGGEQDVDVEDLKAQTARPQAQCVCLCSVCMCLPAPCPSPCDQLLSGGEQDVDVEDLRVHTRYSGGYTESDRTIKMFWEVVKELSREEKSQLLKFVTSCSRPPLLGFKHLNPPLTIHKVNVDASMWATLGGPDVAWLPTASTCYNLLKLPTYQRASTLRDKLKYAISSGTGFELS
ncbi:unnamed protein product, partial [Closterium sp. NIES-53]